MANRSRPRATLAQKIKVLDLFHQANKSQAEIVKHFESEFSISTSSMSEWLKKEPHLRRRFNEIGSALLKNSRRESNQKYEEINRAMDLMVQQRLERREPVSETILREYWSIYAHQYGVDDPKRLVGFSHGWLCHFKKRHGLSRKQASSSGSLDGSNTPNRLFITPAADDTATASPTDAEPRENVYLDGSRSAINDSMSTLSLSNEPMSTNTTLMNGDTQSNRDDYETNPSYEIINPPYQNSMNFNNFEYGRPPSQNPPPPQAQPPQAPQATQAPHGSQNSLASPYEPIAHRIRGVRRQQISAPPPPHQEQEPANMPPQPPALPPGHTNGLQLNLPVRFKENASLDYFRQRNREKVLPQSPNASRSPPIGQMATDANENIIINASDMERFIYQYADSFFHHHQFEYPQTLKLFQDFKNAFFNERIVNLRAMQQQMMRQQMMRQQMMRQPEADSDTNTQEPQPVIEPPPRRGRKRRSVEAQQQSPSQPQPTNGASVVGPPSSGSSTRDIIEDFLIREEVNAGTIRQQALNARKRWRGSTA